MIIPNHWHFQIVAYNIKTDKGDFGEATTIEIIDCDTEEQKALVALAHDVFNMGTNESWEYNSKEIRNFYSLDFICSFVEQIGFKFDKRTILQKGDPTKNALMMFTKI